MYEDLILYRKDIEPALLEVYKTIKSKNIYKNEIKYNKLDYTKLDILSRKLSFHLNNVELKPSKVHGRGVFTTKKILKNQIITMYPGDIVVFLTEGRKNEYTKKCSVYSDEMQDFKYKNPETYSDYQFSLDFYYDMYGNPDFDKNPAYLGHFINDSARCNTNYKSVPIYLNITSIKRNCDFEIINGLHVAIIAIRDIEIGEELYLSYGVKYWANIIKKEQNK